MLFIKGKWIEENWVSQDKCIKKGIFCVTSNDKLSTFSYLVDRAVVLSQMIIDGDFEKYRDKAINKYRRYIEGNHA